MIPLEFPAGITTLESKNAAIVNWRDGHLVRWDNAITLRPVGGWEKMVLPSFASPLRKMHKWSANNGVPHVAYLCETNVYIEESGSISEITPVDGLIPPAVNQAGYSNDKYSKYAYSTPRPGESRVSYYTPMYSLDNWGEELRAMTSADGRYLGWSPSAAPGTLLTAVAGAPTGNRSFLITPERHAMIFGANEFDKFAWSDEEDDTNWNYADVLSRAGFYDVSPKSQIVTQQLFDAGILMFTPIMTYVIEWAGLPYTYTYRPIGKTSIPYSPASICATPIGVVWPSVDGMWIFDGTNALTMPCPLWDRIIDEIGKQATNFMGACVHLENKGEVWWFYASKNAAIGTNDRYVMLDYRSGVWAGGKLNRLCGYSYANEINPVMSDGTNVWKHESGFSYEGAEMPWIESMNLNGDGGETWITVSKILPDISGDIEAIRFRMAKTNDRAGYTPDNYSPQRKKNGKGWVDIRETARDMRLRIEMVANSNWGTSGPILFDTKLRGKK